MKICKKKIIANDGFLQAFRDHGIQSLSFTIIGVRNESVNHRWCATRFEESFCVRTFPDFLRDILRPEIYIITFPSVMWITDVTTVLYHATTAVYLVLKVNSNLLLISERGNHFWRHCRIYIVGATNEIDRSILYYVCMKRSS